MAAKLIDLTGKKFGFWSVIEYAGKKPGHTLWRCRCECDTEATVGGSFLRSGQSRGCRKCSGRWKRIDVTGQVFGGWSVLKRVGGRNSNFLCRCECGLEKLVALSNLYNRGRCPSCAAKLNSGDNNPSRKKKLAGSGYAPLTRTDPWYRTAAAMRARAKKGNLPFGFCSSAECAEWLRARTPEDCPVLGVRLSYGGDLTGPMGFSPSADRIDSTRGYTPDNIMVMSAKANAMKSNATPQELIAFAKWVFAAYGAE